MSEPSIYLWSDSLQSKWGFGDGDIPDSILDHVGDEVGFALDWHAVLRKLVRKHLLPALEDAGHSVEVYDIETNHNPIRASKIDGVDVDDYSDRNVPTRLDGVKITWPQIKQAIDQSACHLAVKPLMW